MGIESGQNQRIVTRKIGPEAHFFFFLDEINAQKKGNWFKKRNHLLLMFSKIIQIFHQSLPLIN